MFWKLLSEEMSYPERNCPNQSMNAGGCAAVIISMTDKTNLTPKQKEIQSLFARGKTPETIAIRMGMKISKVLMVIALVPKPVV